MTIIKDNILLMSATSSWLMQYYFLIFWFAVFLYISASSLRVKPDASQLWFNGFTHSTKKSMLKLLNELSSVSPVHTQFFILFSCSSSFTFGQLSMNLCIGSPRLEIQSLVVYATVSFLRHQQKVQIPDSRVKKTSQAWMPSPFDCHLLW